MDKITFNGINSNLLKPKENEVSVDNVSSNEVEIGPQKGDIPPNTVENCPLSSSVNPSVNPILFNIARKAVLNTEIVSDFIKDKVIKIGDFSSGDFENNITEYLSNALKSDKSFENEIRKKLSGVPFDLIEDLKRRIIITESLPESAVILKMLFALEDKDEIFHQLMLPYLEERSGLGDNKVVESNKRFYLRFLQALPQDELKEMLLNIRYPEVIRVDNFASTLLNFAEPKLLLDVLEKYQINFALPQEDQVAVAHKIQMIQLNILQSAEARTKLNDEALVYLEALYTTSLSKRVSDDIAKLFSYHYAESAKSVFIRELTDTVDDTSSENRYRRYIAINHLVNAMNYDSESIDCLKGFILKDKDPFVVGNAVYLLANNMGENGKQALTDVIVNQIENEVTSLPLSCLNLLYIAKDQNVYLNLIKNIFSFDYKDKDKKPIRAAFENLSGSYLCPIAKENGDFLFDPVDVEQSEQAIDLIERIGVDTFFQWALSDSVDEKSLRTNSQELLNYSCTINQERVYSLLTRTLIDSSISQSSELTRKLAGMGQVGSSDL